MSVVYEPRVLIDGSYPPIDDHTVHSSDHGRYSDPNDPVPELPGVDDYTIRTPPFDSSDSHRLDQLQVAPVSASTPTDQKEPSPGEYSPRIPTVTKPSRDVTKNDDGKFVCTFPDCAEEVKVFSRKCEWNKHMDKHDRPYRCAYVSCARLPGFTYSGGLLRHEREVHGKHGGPKNQFNCPHDSCKRHAGKGFTRLENLNEHLRRVHTPNGNGNGNGNENRNGSGSGADAGALTLGLNLGMGVGAGSSLGVGVGGVGADADVGINMGMGVGVGAPESDAMPEEPPSEIVPKKRKRSSSDATDLREEMRRVRQENEELRRQVDNQNRQTVAMMQQIAQLQAQLHATAAAAAAGMHPQVLEESQQGDASAVMTPTMQPSPPMIP